VRTKKVLPVFFTIVALTILAVFLGRNYHYIAGSYGVRPLTVFAIAALSAVMLLLLSLANRALFGNIGVKAGRYDWFRLVTVSAFINLLPLSAGLAAKAVYLKRVYRIPYRSFALGQIGLFTLFMSTSGVLGFSSLVLAYPAHLSGPIGPAFALMCFAAILLFPPEILLRRLQARLPGNAVEQMEGMRKAIKTVPVIHGANLLAAAAVLKLSFDTGPAEVSFAACVVFCSAGILTRFVSLTPGALGIREFMIGGLAYLVGFEFKDAVIASTLSRVIEVVVICVLGSLFTYRVSSRMISPDEE
jgi:uncharacterized membrane protein YbhN (UPF0104 family)